MTGFYFCTCDGGPFIAIDCPILHDDWPRYRSLRAIRQRLTRTR